MFRYGFGSPALEAGLAQALVQALAERAARDLGVELAREAAVAVALEGRVGAPARREQVRRRARVRVLGAASCHPVRD